MNEEFYPIDVLSFVDLALPIYRDAFDLWDNELLWEYKEQPLVKTFGEWLDVVASERRSNLERELEDCLEKQGVVFPSEDERMDFLCEVIEEISERDCQAV